MGVLSENIILVDSRGVIYKGRTQGMNPYKENFALETRRRTLSDMTARYFSGLPDWQILIVAAVAGLLGVLLAIFFQKAAILLVGFYAGGYLAVFLFSTLNMNPLPALGTLYHRWSFGRHSAISPFRLDADCPVISCRGCLYLPNHSNERRSSRNISDRTGSRRRYNSRQHAQKGKRLNRVSKKMV
jgi:hypothetical protein